MVQKLDLAENTRYRQAGFEGGHADITSYLLKKMKKELPILRGHPERGEEISHADPEMFIMMIDRGRMVWLDL